MERNEKGDMTAMRLHIQIQIQILIEP